MFALDIAFERGSHGLPFGSALCLAFLFVLKHLAELRPYTDQYRAWEGEQTKQADC
jgi:hypothetical protein